MDRETFAQRLHQASVAARDFARTFVLEPIPDEMLFRVRLNQSYDLNSLHRDEHLYPDDSALNITGKLAHCTEDEVVNVLWRDGRVPEWVDIAAIAKTESATIMQMLCCGRFTSNEQLLYHAREGWPPFHAVGPVLPPDYQQGGKFSIYTRCEALNLAEVEALGPHRENIWSLTLLGPECNDSTLNNLPTFPAMQALDLKYTATIGSGLIALDRQPKLRALNIVVRPSQQFDLAVLPHLPSLSTLTVWHAPAISFDFGQHLLKLPNLNHLDLQCSGFLKLDGRLPRSMWALALLGQRLKGTLICCDQVEHLSLHFPEGDETEIVNFLRNTDGVKFLNLSRTPVSKECVMQFVNRWPLEFLDISKTNVREEFATELAELHPGLRVVHNKGVIKGTRVPPGS